MDDENYHEEMNDALNVGIGPKIASFALACLIANVTWNFPLET